jgi:hypothetical protein
LPRPIDFLTALLLLGGIAVGAAPRAEEAQGTVIRDPYYGEALFHFYQKDDFTALTHLLVARAAGRVPHHDAEAELLLGGLYLSYGQHTRAAQVFERLLDETTTPSVRDRAWFYLGKVRYQRGLYGEALQAFARVGADLGPALAAELPMLIAQSHLAQGEFDQAAKLLAGWQGSEAWSPYARYNLGVALVRLNRTAEGAILLDEVGRMPAQTPELRSLRDKANLALGYAWLQANDAVQARPVLQRVRLHGPYASKALLGAGWADAMTADYRAALVPWLELVNRDLLDSAVQESFLAIPYAFGRLEAHGSAVERYQRALGSFDTELENLNGAIARARNGELVPALLAADDAELGRWYWQLQELPAASDSRYLYHLLADHSFQEGLKNYRDLAALDRHLEDWRQKIGVFEDMVATRAAAYRERLPRTQRVLATVDLASMQSRRDALAARLDQISDTRDIAALATPAEADQWQRLLALEKSPQWTAAENVALRDRQRVLKGVLAWSLDREYKARLWRQQRTLRELDAALVRAVEQHDSVANARSDEPERLAGFATRIAGIAPRLSALQASLGTALNQQQDQLVAMAVSELESRKERLASYRIQARFALAAIYDRAGGVRAATQPARPQP